MDLGSPTFPQGDDANSEISPASRCSHHSTQLCKAQRRVTVKGSHARFLYENPRFINEPIRYVVAERGAQSVGECLDWSEVLMQQKKSHAPTIASTSDQSFVTSHQSSYLIPTSSSYQLMRKKSRNGTNPIVPNYAVKCKEKISYHHDYNSRLDPNYPQRGKLHGNFVLREEGQACTSPAPSSKSSMASPAPSSKSSVASPTPSSKSSVASPAPSSQSSKLSHTSSSQNSVASPAPSSQRSKLSPSPSSQRSKLGNAPSSQSSVTSPAHSQNSRSSSQCEVNSPETL